MFVTALFPTTYGRKKMEKSSFEGRNFLDARGFEWLDGKVRVQTTSRINNLQDAFF